MSIPINVIIMWSGAIIDIPQGWLLCNGQNGTPNLRNRFVVGAGSKYTLSSTGGSENSILAAHSHGNSSTDTVASHTHGFTGFGAGNANTPHSAGGNFNQDNVGTTTNGAHTHSFNTTASGESGAGKNMPPYYALAYIMYGGQ